MTLARRSFLTGLAASALAAPAIVRAASLMPVRGIVMDAPIWQELKYPGFNGPTRYFGYDVYYQGNLLVFDKIFEQESSF